MPTRIAINGFGRIGRLAFRQFMALSNGGHQHDLEVVAVNDIAPLDNLIYLLRYDTAQRDPEADIRPGDGAIQWDNRKVRFLQERNPTNLPWDELEVDIVVEASGIFTKRDDAAKHLQAGAQSVLITAPAKQPDLTICMGVNEDKYKAGEHKIISNASCTTNCLAPVAKILHERFGIVTGFLTTVHAVTSSQAIVDGPMKKWRRGRSGAFNIVPTTTGAAVATTEVLPELEGKLDGLAMRVPVPTGSIIDFVAQTERPVTVEAVNQALRQAGQTDRLQGILDVTDEELVSSDIVGSTYSALVDGQSTTVLGDHTLKVLAWYDNEWGYARRVVDLAAYMGERIHSAMPA